MKIKKIVCLSIAMLGMLFVVRSQNLNPIIGNTTSGGCEYKIELPDYGVYFYKISSSDTLKKLTDSSCVIFYIKSCEGEMDVEEWYINNEGIKKELKAKGNYMASLDLLKQYMGKEDDFGDVEMFVESYFQPLKNGTWKYYSENGEFLKEEYYQKGIKK